MTGHTDGDIRVFYQDPDPTDANEHAVVAYVDTLEEAQIVLAALIEHGRDLEGQVVRAEARVEVVPHWPVV